MTLIYWLLCLLIGLLPAWIIYRSDRKKNIPVRWLPALLRFFTCFMTAALLLAPAFPSVKTEEEKPLLLWLQDNSSSMKKALGKDTILYRKKIYELWEQWRKDYTVVPLTFGSEVKHDSIFSLDERSTNMSEALQTATSQYQDHNVGAVILAGDGIYNQGLDPLYAPVGNAIPVYTIGVGDSTQPRDIAIIRVYANKTVPLNSSFEIIADIRAEKFAGSQTDISILHKGNSVARSSVKIDKAQFTSSLRFNVKAAEKGFQRYSVQIPALQGEQNQHNNRMDFYVEVIDEQVKILIMAAAPHPDIGAIRSALESVPDYKVDIKTGTEIPANSNGYAMVIAHQIPGINLPPLKDIPIPTWYILGRQSNMAQFNQVQSLLKINGNSSAANDALPVLQPGFNYFTLPEGIRELVAKMPPLQAPYGNYVASAGSQVLFNQQIGNVQTSYPLWLVQMGEKPGAILCGEGLWRWRMYEYKNFKKHDIVDELIRQTVSLLRVEKDLRPFRVFMDKYVLTDNEPVNIYAELRNENSELVNGPAAKITLTDSAGKPLNYELEKSGNSYRLQLGLLSPGSYHFKGNVVYNGKSYTSEGSFIVEAVPLEELRTHADYELLSKLASQTGGLFFNWQQADALTDSLKNNAAIRPVIHSDKTFTQWIDVRWFFFIILLLAATEWLLRKYWSA